MNDLACHDKFSGRYDFLNCFCAIISWTNPASTAACMTKVTSSACKRLWERLLWDRIPIDYKDPSRVGATQEYLQNPATPSVDAVCCDFLFRLPPVTVGKDFNNIVTASLVDRMHRSLMRALLNLCACTYACICLHAAANTQSHPCCDVF